MPVDCLFCRIVAGEVPAKLAHEDDVAIAFHDINPQAPVHVLVIPREHVASTEDLGPGSGPMLERLVAVATQVARDTGVADGGYRIVTNVGDDAGQSVHHLHLHVLGGRRLGWPPG